MRNTLGYIVLIFFIATVQLNAQTNIPGGTINGETWTSHGSPYIVDGNVTIEDLIIEPGVEVLFSGDYLFEVDGDLFAEGFYSDSIFFKSTDQNTGGWAGIEFKSGAGDCKLAYCRIEGSGTRGIYIDGSTPIIQNCRISNNEDEGIYFKKTTIQLIHCIIADNGGDGITLETSRIIATNCIFANNQKHGINSTKEEDTIDAVNCTIAGNMDRGIDCKDGTLSLTNTIIYHNTNPIKSNDQRTIVSYSNIEGEDTFPGTGNINLDPDFIYDLPYNLSDSSLCIDTGNPGISFRDYYRPPSQGSVLNDMGAYGGPEASGWFPPIFLKPQTMNFGNVMRDSSKTLTLRAFNYRNVPISADIITSGEDASDFVPGSAQVDLSVLDSVDIDVIFSPDSELVYSAEMEFKTGSHGEIILDLSGVGVLPHLSLLTTEIHFGPVDLGESKELYWLAQNSGTAPLEINIIPPDQNGIFTIDTLQKVLHPGSAIDTFWVTFQPESAILFVDSLQLICNDPSLPRSVLPISGTGIGPLLAYDPENIDFGELNVGKDSTQNLLITNHGNAQLIVDSLVFGNSLNDVYSINPTVNDISIDPDSSISVGIRFKPYHAGEQITILSIYSNVSSGNPGLVNISGKGITPQILLSHKAMDYGSVLVGYDSSSTMTITNHGNANLIIDSLRIDEPASPFYIEGSPFDGMSISPDSSKNMTITFAPETASDFSAALLLFSNDPQNGQDTILLSGIGYNSQAGRASIHISDTLLAFGDTPIDSISNLSVTVSNIGDEVLVLYKDSLKITGGDASDFQISKIYSSNIEIGPSGNEIIPISFKPEQRGPTSDFLRIVSNDAKRPTLQIGLQGNGVVESEPEITITLDTLNSTLPFSESEPGDLSFIISNSQNVDSAYIYFREGGTLTYTKMPLFHRDMTNFWSIQINSVHITARGLEYYVTAHQNGLPIYYPDQSEYAFNFIYVNVTDVIFPYETAKSIYQMISIPLDTRGKTLSELFSDNLGPYNNQNYRVFDCINGTDYQECTDMSTPLPPGKAIWLITREKKNLDLSDGQSVPTDRNFEISLKKGWNMIASPYAFTVDWQNVSKNLMIREYVNQDWTFASELEPFKGYAVQVDQDTVINIPPRQEMLLKKRNGEQSPLPPFNWTIQLSAQTGDLKDQFNYIGTFEGSQNSIDRFDHADPPPIGEHIRLALLPEDRESLYSTDIRQPGMEGYRFKIRVNSNVSGKMLLNLIPENLPDGFEWVIISLEEKVIYRESQIQISKNSGNFELLVGNSDFISEASSDYNILPLTYQLHQNFPNPFNPLTTIKFQLPEAQRVTATIYNILGQKIIKLSKNELFEAGYHQYSWDGKDKFNYPVSSGIYFLRFKMANYEKTIKMILQQ